MAFDDAQLDEIRSRLKVSAVVGAKFQLVKKGAEYVAKGNESFTVNDKKGFWCEFGQGGDGKPHDIFDFMQIYEGYTFVGAVEELAQQAGVTLQHRAGRSGKRNDARPASSQSEPPPHDSVPDERSSAASSSRGKKEIVATWDYVDAENVLLYQVVRMQERMPDGEWKRNSAGKVWKTFLQRRPSPDRDGTWVLGLDFVEREEPHDPHEFLKSPTGTWLRATDERRSWWPQAPVRTFADAGNVEHWMFGANDVLDELQEPKDEQRTIFMPEGEGKVDVLREWGLLGVTNSGGAKHFTANCAELFRNARHVVLLQDNDRAGAERVAVIAPMLKAVGVESVQVLNFRDVWPKCPMKGDVKDWRDAGGGTKDKLLEIVDGLKEWAPEPYKSKFGAKTAFDLATGPVRAYPWRIKHIMPMNDDMLIMGPSRSGKTFEVLDMAMHCHFGNPFASKKVVQCGIVYCTYEGATGFENRLRGYLAHHGLAAADLHSFAYLTRPPGLYASEENVDSLAAEIIEIAKTFKLPLGFVVIDTHNAATRGSSEIKSEDMDKILSRYQQLREKTQVPNVIVGHTNANGDHRGNGQFFNGIETALLVQRVQEHAKGKNPIDLRDEQGRVRRKVSINKQREGDDRISWEFVLEEVTIGTDEDGDPITSMVSVEPATHLPKNVEQMSREKPDGMWLSDVEVSQFKALLKAVNEVGAPPPAQLDLPQSIARVVTTVQLGEFWRKVEPKDDGETPTKYAARTKQALIRFRRKLANRNVIGVGKVETKTDTTIEETHYLWLTGRRVFGRGLQYPPQAAKKPEAKPLLAPGESEDALREVF